MGGVHLEGFPIWELQFESGRPIEHRDADCAVAFVHLLVERRAIAHVLMVAMEPRDPRHAAFEKQPFNKPASSVHGCVLIGILLDEAAAPIVASIADVQGIDPGSILRDIDVLTKDRPITAVVINVHITDRQEANRLVFFEPDAEPVAGVM
ncbi:MAG: hypothetical protein AAAC47_08130, partial [Pararhizobium sp.]